MPRRKQEVEVIYRLFNPDEMEIVKLDENGEPIDKKKRKNKDPNYHTARIFFIIFTRI